MQGRRTKKILLAAACVLFALILGLLATVQIGKAVNRKTPDEGINESRYVTVNGSRQWISIYGENKNNPVLLYLHGGPGAATSSFDYAFTRKWADVYTVVTWDQRNCGKSYQKSDKTTLTFDLFLQDGYQLSQFLLEYLQTDKITLLGHSWGSYLGANLALNYPDLYDAFIGVGQLVNVRQNEIAFQEVAAKWVEGDPEGKRLFEQLTPEMPTLEHFNAKNELMVRYGYHIYANERDYNLFFTQLFNPYYSLSDWLSSPNQACYVQFMLSEEFLSFDLTDKTSYEIPYFNVNGDKDYQTNYLLAESYFHSVSAPKKCLYLMENTTHGLLETKSEEFSLILHNIKEEIEKAEILI